MSRAQAKEDGENEERRRTRKRIRTMRGRMRRIRGMARCLA